MSSDILYQAEGSAAIRLEYDDDVGGDPKKKKKLHLAVMCFTKEAHLLHMAFYNNRHISGTTEESDGAEGDVPRCVSLRSTTSQDGDQATKEVAELHFAHVPNDVVVMAVVVFCVAGNDFSPLAVDDRSVASTCVQVTRPDGASFIRHPLGSSSLRRDSGGLSPRSRPVAMFGVYFDRRCTKRSQWELAIEAATISGLSWEPIVTSVRNTVGLGRLGEMRVPPGRLGLVEDVEVPNESWLYPVEPIAAAAKVKISIGWDVIQKDKAADVDVACFAVDARSEHIIATCFWAHLDTLCGALVHSGDNLTGDGDGDDETITIQTNLIPDTVRSLVVLVTSQGGPLATVAKNLHCTISQSRPIEGTIVGHCSQLEQSFPVTSWGFIAAVLVKGGSASSPAWSCHVPMTNLDVPSLTAVTDAAVRQAVLACVGSRMSASTGRFASLSSSTGAAALLPRVQKHLAPTSGSNPNPTSGSTAKTANSKGNVPRAHHAPSPVDWRLVGVVIAIIVAMFSVLRL